jgi:zona occludens toxin (predicted ATPase)
MAFLLGMVWLLVVCVRFIVKPAVITAAPYDATAEPRVSVTV